MEELHHQPDTKVLLLILTANYFISIIWDSHIHISANILYSNDIKRAILYEKILRPPAMEDRKTFTLKIFLCQHLPYSYST